MPDFTPSRTTDSFASASGLAPVSSSLSAVHSPTSVSKSAIVIFFSASWAAAWAKRRQAATGASSMRVIGSP
ncbi:MAG: hypothetical protein HY293_07430 [Planctomycetes bacterium]|nr:hypothetical protein [Planctomycetota bacterium]